MKRLLARFFGGQTPEQRSWSVYRDAYLQGYDTSSGVDVNAETALGIPAFYACVRVLSEAMASLPLRLLKRNPDGSRERVTDHPLMELLKVAPNPEMTAFEWRELAMVHLTMRGNAYSRIVRQRGYPVALWPMHPDHVHLERRNGHLGYIHRPPTGDGGTYAAADVLHFKGFGGNGLIGYNPLQVAREAFAHYLAAQGYGAKFFKNNAWASGVLKYPGKLDTESARRMASSWRAAHGGDNQGAVAVLEEGVEFAPISVAPEDAQFIETLKLKRSDVCGIMRVPPHMIADLERATFSNIEQQDLYFAKHTCVPYCSRLEGAYNVRLLHAGERGILYLEHDLAGIMRGDLASRVEAYTKLWDRGVYNADEIRALENMNAQPDGLGEVYYVPSNFYPAAEGPPAALPPVIPPPEEDDQADEAQVNACGCGHEHRTAPDVPRGMSETRSARIRIQRSYRGVLADAMRRVVRRDVQQIRAAMKKHLRTKGSLADWLVEYFADTEYARRQLLPVFESLAEAIGPELSQEVESEWDMNEGLRHWVEAYVATAAEFHANGARDEISALLESGEDSPIDAIEAHLDGWENGGPNGSNPRAVSTALRESTRFGGALAGVVYTTAGVTAWTWRTSGEGCPWCDNLDGQVVGVSDGFFSKGDSVESADGGSMTMGHDVLHPPLHDGCDCAVEPVKE